MDMDLKKLKKDLEKLQIFKKEIRWGHYGKVELNKAIKLLIKELDYLTMLD